ncbi:hypothetical protein AB0F17_27500 [Nonomuraea sp. NPDC026600]|uniref:hypothetical protein n=1 Tax=Nonomuraea sp. NPDC026600 TaxID=3155363 RepID=UPI00340DCA17
MGDDIPGLVAELSPYVAAAVGAYGAAVLDKVTDESADTTVVWGRRVLQRVFGAKKAEDAPDALRDLADNPDDADLQAVLRVAIDRALQGDDELAREVQRLIDEARRRSSCYGLNVSVNASASDQAQQAIQGHGTQTNTFHGTTR